MNIYRNVENGKLYMLERLILDIKYTNRNSNAGIYPEPYKHQERLDVFKSKDKLECEKFVEENFSFVFEI